ncbi:TIGR03086 family metal-binding protein [Pseudonocardia tropica]|uniref:TIGR03086 family metal-binding protein n=1 Tax=Pseudonocardia tropica TaxID=681289 RepID=A0ABV1K247_9PSEU
MNEQRAGMPDSGSSYEVEAVAARYRALAERMTARVVSIDDTGWVQPSPCEGWTARDVIDHVVEVQRWPLRATGTNVEDIPSCSVDPVGAWTAASSKLVALLEYPGRAAIEIDVAVAGSMSAAAAVDLIVCGDLAIHTWDLSRATGQDERMDLAEAARVKTQLEFLGDAIRGPGLHGTPLAPPAGADARIQLLAYAGRRAW